MITIREIKNADEYNTFKEMQKEELHILKIGAPWCGPCRVLENTIKNLSEDKIGTTLFGEINADDDGIDSLMAELGVRGVPVLIFYKNGEEVNRTTGLVQADAIYKSIEEYK